MELARQLLHARGARPRQGGPRQPRRGLVEGDGARQGAAPAAGRGRLVLPGPVSSRPGRHAPAMNGCAAVCATKRRMHRSRLSTFVIDCQVDDLDAAAEFWSKVFGRTAIQTDDDPTYR